MKQDSFPRQPKQKKQGLHCQNLTGVFRLHFIFRSYIKIFLNVLLTAVMSYSAVRGDLVCLIFHQEGGGPEKCTNLPKDTQPWQRQN